MIKVRLISLTKPDPGCGFVELDVGMAEGSPNYKSIKDLKNYKTRFKFYFQNKEGIDDFIKQLKTYSEIAFDNQIYAK